LGAELCGFVLIVHTSIGGTCIVDRLITRAASCSSTTMSSPEHIIFPHIEDDRMAVTPPPSADWEGLAKEIYS